MLAGVRIEAADDDLRLAAAQACQRLGRQFDHVEDALFREQAGHFAIADVDRDERAGDFLGVLHHARPRGIRPGGKDLGVAGKVDPGRVQRFLVERRGRDRRHLRRPVPRRSPDRHR